MARTLKELGPICRCGARGTVRADFSHDPALDGGGSALVRRCENCGQIYYYRLSDGHLVPFSLQTALTIDEERFMGRKDAASSPAMDGLHTLERATDPTPCAAPDLALVILSEGNR